MIRYQCPHCQRVTESADVMRGFSVICLGCRQPVHVPERSTLPDAPAPPPPLPRAPAPPPPALPPPLPRAPVPPPVERPVVASDIVPPRPVVIPPPAVEILPLSPDLDRPRPPVKSTPIELKPPPDAGRRRRLIRLGAAGLLMVMLAGVLGVGIRWLAGPRKRQDSTAAEKALESRKDAIRAAFTAPTLKRFAEQHAKWEIAPSDAARSRGKIIVLSWTETGQAPVRVSDNDLIKAILERGRVDDFSFDLPEEFWAEAPADAGTMVGIRWSSEVGGVFRDGKLVDLAGHPPSGDMDTPAVRWRATAIVLDTATSRLTARHEFVGPLPTRAPAVGKKEAAGPRPVEEVGEWLRRLLTGPGKTARGPAPSP